MKRLFALLFAGMFLFAAEYGKITGKVVDSETGDALIGANVMVEGTELGSASDVTGEYVVLYVPAGTYAVVASYLGYDPYTFTNVVVNSDQTTILNFRLRPTVIQVEGVTSIAVREPIVISATQTGRSVTSQDINRLPVTTINQVISLQAGVVQSNLGTHLRGGRANEITYFVDGIVTKVPQTGGQSAQMNPGAVEEVTVVSGGFDAEYGDALSGIINVVTREGGTKPSGSVSWLSDEMFFADNMDNLNFGYNLYEVSFGGPIPLSNRFRYFLSGELMMTKAYVDAFYKVPSPRMDYKGNARFSYLFPNAKGKVTVSGFDSREQWVQWGNAAGNGVSLKYFDAVPMVRQKNWIGSSTFNYMITAQTLTSLKLGMTHFDQVFGNRDYAYEDTTDRQWFQDYRIKGEHLIQYLDDISDNPDLSPRYIIIDSLQNYHEEFTDRDVEALRNNPYGVEGRFYTYGDYRVWRYTTNDDIQARFDLTHSIGKLHEFKTGFDFTQYDMLYADNTLPWVDNPFWDYYNRQPFKLAAFLQDKMDFEGLIARLGLRVDYFDPKAMTYTNPGDFLDSNTTDATASYKISPRLGFSLPVTERMKFRFNYGHYFQLPALDDMYGITDTSVVRIALTRGNTIIGNILIKPQKTVQYEFGLENQFTNDIIFGFTTYFKDIYDLSQTREVEALPTPYFQMFNVDYGNIKGFEFRLDKLMSSMWSVGITYTLQFAKGTAAYAGEWYDDHYYYQIEPPVIDYWLDFDERNTVNANLDLDLPRDFVFIPLQNVSSSFVFSYHSGQPYTPKNLKGEKMGDDNSARKPSFWNVDFNASKGIPLGPVNLRINALIQNLFNTEQVLAVYETSGDAVNHGDPEPELDAFTVLTLSSPRYSPQGDFNHDGVMSRVEEKTAEMQALTDFYDNPRNFYGPFKVQLGAGISF